MARGRVRRGTGTAERARRPVRRARGDGARLGRGRARRRRLGAARARRHDAPPAGRDRHLPARVRRGRPGARHHPRDPWLGSPAEPRRAAADRPRPRRRAAGGPPSRARPGAGREEALEAARPLLRRRAARGGVPGGRSSRLPRRARAAGSRRPARPRPAAAPRSRRRLPRCTTTSSRPLRTRRARSSPRSEAHARSWRLGPTHASSSSRRPSS